MVGLLDFDTTVKDELGLTQADRNQPLWSGLIKAGLLSVAAGGDLMPAQRAQYVAQMGGAIADIPEHMARLRSDAAQQMLRAQQVRAGKLKVDQAAKLAEYAKSPEFQRNLEKADPATRAMIQMAVDAGDVDAAVRAYSTIGTTEHKQKLLDIKEAERKLKEQKASGAFQGTGMDAQAMNTLLQGKVDSPEYYLAYNHLSKARTTFDPQTGQAQHVQPMDLRRFPVPTWNGAPSQAPAEGGGAAQPGASEPAPGAPQVTAGPAVVDKPPDPAATRKLHDAQVVASQVRLAANDFLSEWKKATPQDRARAMAGASTPLNSAWTNLAMLLKQEAVFNLGVITGPDLGILQRAIADPSSIRSLMANESDVEEALNKVLGIMDTGISKREELLKRPKAGSAQPSKPSDDKVRTYNPATGKLE